MLDPNDVVRNQRQPLSLKSESDCSNDFKPILSIFHPVLSFQVQFQCFASGMITEATSIP
jgi:hypothetical protein